MKNDENECIHALEAKNIKILMDPEIFDATRKKLTEKGRKFQSKLIKIIVGIDLIDKVNCIIWNIRNSINSEEESFIFGKRQSDDKDDIKINVQLVFDREIVEEVYKVKTDDEIYKDINYGNIQIENPYYS